MKKWILTLQIILTVFLNLNGQVISDDAPFVRYTSEDGLSQQIVRAIVQDKYGFIWVGTEDGLNKFDGYEFRQYRNIRNDANSLSDNFIYALYPSKDGGLWIGTNNSGLAKFDPKTAQFKNYPPMPDNPDAISGGRIYTLFEDDNGILWIGTFDGGLSKFDPETEKFTNYKTAEESGSIASNMVLGIQKSSDGTLWVRTEQVLQKFNEKTQSFSTVESSLSMPSLDMRGSFYIDNQDVVWTSSGSTLYKYNTVSGDSEFITLGDSINPSMVLLYIRPLNENYLWVSSFGHGLFLVDKSTYETINLKHDPANPKSVMSGGLVTLMQDKSGSLWVGGNISGISKLNINRKKFDHYVHNADDPTTVSTNTIRSILVDSENNLWVGFEGSGTLLNKLVFDPNAERYLNQDQRYNKLYNSTATTCILEDALGNIWLGTWGAGVHFLPSGDTVGRYQVQSDAYGNSLSDNIIQAFLEDRDGNIWIGTETGLDVYNPNTGRIRTFLHDPDNSNSLAPYGVQANTLLEDAHGNIWVGTWGGLTRMEPKDKSVNTFNADYEFIRYQNNPEEENTISDNRIISLFYDKNIDPNEIYAGTYGSGLNRIKFNNEDPKSNEISIYTRFQGLPNDVVYGILSDNNGELWVSTNDGLANFNPSTNRFIKYDANDGLQGNQFFWGARAKSVDGRLIFGGLNGFNLFNPDDIVSDQTIPSLVFTDLIVLNEPVRVNQKVNKNIILEKGINQVEEIKLSYRENVFTIEFSGLHYAFPDNNQYRYMLEGFDDDWVYVDSRKRFASYTNLDNRKYIFKFDASNYDGVWTEEPRALNITITPPFWKRWWFRIAVFLLLALLVYEIYKKRMEMVKRDKEILEGKIKEGEDIINEKVKEVEKQQEEIKKRDIEEQEMRFMNRGIAKFSELLSSGDDSLRDLSQSVISELVNYLGGAMGVIYVLQNDQDEDRLLELYGAYAVDSETLNRKHIKPGEGYIGTCFSDRKTTVIDEVPDDYVKLTSGLGGVLPSSICLVPVMQSGNIQGVIEVASLIKLDDYKVRFIEKIAENITSVVSIRKASEKLNELLEQSHQQTEEMRAQEEEMRQNMEEMYATQEEMARREEEWTQEKGAYQSKEEKFQTEIRALKKEIRALKKQLLK